MSKTDKTSLRNSTYILGVLILLVTSIPSLLTRGSGLPGLIIAMLVISLGLSGIKATLPPFIGMPLKLLACKGPFIHRDKVQKDADRI
jgi:hypothetical protein